MIDTTHQKLIGIENVDQNTFLRNLSHLSQDQRNSLIQSVREFINERESYELFHPGIQPQLKIKKEIVEILTSQKEAEPESKISSQINNIKKIFNCWISADRVLAEIARIRYPNTLIVSRDDNFFLIPVYDETDLW